MNLYINFLWHFHQPYYYDSKKEVFHLPWVRLHALRSYYTLGKYLELYPTLTMNFNFTPSLIESIGKYIEGKYDYLFILENKGVGELSNEEKLYIIKNSFYGYYPTTIKPYKKYRELYIKKVENELSDTVLLEKFTKEDLIDLIVLSNLAWFSEYLKEKDEFVKYLIKKGRAFSEYEKYSLLEKELQIIKKILPLYKKLQDRGQVEITTTPYAHPIIPLIVDNYSAKISLPNNPLPKYRFSYPQDADLHIKKAISTYYKVFNYFPKGMWPSEGAVGNFILPLFWENGVEWIATDSEILGMTKDIFLTYDKDGVSENPEILYRPYILKMGEPKLFIIFRDHALSDLFGFVYSGMSIEEGVTDFVSKLTKIQEKLKNRKGNYLISVILDGENPWEYYEKGRQDKFFKGLLDALLDLSFVKTTKVSKFIEKEEIFEFLPNLYTGSWIGHNLRTWIGDREKNMAWDYLFQVRKEFEQFSGREKEKAIESLLFAEGSDWFWWYGEGHDSPEEDKLDALFRTHLRNVYLSLDKTPPSFLEKPIITIRPRGIPLKKISPKIDGKVDEKEWDWAGLYEVKSGAMSELNISLPFYKLLYGNDELNFYIRLDLKEDCCDNIIVILNDREYKYNIKNNMGDTTFEYKDVLEISIPFKKEEKARFKLIFEKGDKRASFPLDYYMIIPIK